jgi:hypothetical protein
MSAAKLLLSGLLVASGLILAAFTLHGRFAPGWEAEATAAGEGVLAVAVQERDSAGEGASDRWATQLVVAEPAVAADARAAATDRKRVERKLAEKRLAQKKDEAQEEPQTVFPWLWNLLANTGK